MKTLKDTLNEGILDIDSNVKGLDSELMIRNLFEEYVFNNSYDKKGNQERLDGLQIDDKKHIIDISNCVTSRYNDRRVTGINVLAVDSSHPFPGFPKGWTIIGYDGTKIRTTLYSQTSPANVVKINSEKIIEVMKKHGLML